MSASAPANTFASELIGRGAISGRQLVILAVCFVLNMLDGFDITVMSFTAPPIGDELGLSAERLGIVFSAALAGMMIGAMFLAPLSDVVGRRRVILGSFLVIGTMMSLTSLIQGLAPLVALRFVTGLGVGAMLASLASIAAEYLPERFRSFGVVAVTAGYPFGAVVGGFISAPLISELGWRSVFVAGGMATLAMTVLVFLLVPESLEYLCNRRPKNALLTVNGILARIGKAPIDAFPEAAAANTQAKAHVGSLLTANYRSRTILLWTTMFFCFITLYFLLSWIPQLVVESGLSLEKGIYAAAAFNLGGVAGILLLGILSTRQPLTNLIGGSLIGGAFLMFVFGLAPQQTALLMILTALIGVMMQGGFSGLYAVAAKMYPAEIRATGVGWAIGLGRFGAVVGPYIGGILIDAQFSMATNFALFAVPLLIAGILAYMLRIR